MAVQLYGSLACADVRAALDVACNEAGAWDVYLVKNTERVRTPAQNRLFRMLLRKLAQQQGHSVQYWRDFLVERYLGFEEHVTEDGYLRRMLCSTAELSVTEFTSFLNACLAYAAEHQVELG